MTAAQASCFPGRQRIGWIDAVRGGAVVAMIAYHLGFDLNTLGWLHQDINHDSRWLAARTLILGTFLLTAGASFALARARGVSLKAQLVRIARIAVAALLVTAGSWLVFPRSAIYFGTLHAIAVMSLILLVVPRGVWLPCLLGVAAIALGIGFADSRFDHPGLAWIGFMTRKPITEDYVPLLPWIGACLIGYGMTNGMLRSQRLLAIAYSGPRPSALAWMGRHSLAIYLLHQPVMLGALIGLTRVIRP